MELHQCNRSEALSDRRPERLRGSALTFRHHAADVAVEIDLGAGGLGGDGGRLVAVQPVDGLGLNRRIEIDELLTGHAQRLELRLAAWQLGTDGVPEALLRTLRAQRDEGEQLARDIHLSEPAPN